MTEEIKAKRDDLAEEYCIRPLPEALKKDLLKYRPDNLKIIQRLEYAAYKHGFDAGYALGLEQAKVLVEALEKYENEKSWVDETTRDKNGMAYTHSIYKMRQIAIEALKLFKERVGHE